MLQGKQRLRSPWHSAAHSILLHFLHTPSKPSSIKRFLWKCLPQSTPSWYSHPHSKSALYKSWVTKKVWLVNDWNRYGHSIIGISRYLLGVGIILSHVSIYFQHSFFQGLQTCSASRPTAQISFVSVHPVLTNTVSSQSNLSLFLIAKLVYSGLKTIKAVEKCLKDALQLWEHTTQVLRHKVSRGGVFCIRNTR
jgi:hypothetical protein